MNKTKKQKFDEKIFKQQKFNGVMPSPEDKRDYTIDMVAKCVAPLPSEYESPNMEILNQSIVGSCVAHGCATGLMIGEQVILGNHNEFSRGYIYGNRADSDYKGEGMYLRQALKQLNKCGDVLQKDFPYNQEWPTIQQTLQKEGEERLAQLALPYAITDYYRCYDENDIKNTIINRGGCVICVPVYSDFGKDLHKTKTNVLEGYHCMIIVGWTMDYWVVQNSWGEKWGYEGKLHMDYDYPMSEAWGLTINSDHKIEPNDKKNIFQKIFYWIKKIIQNWINWRNSK